MIYLSDHYTIASQYAIPNAQFNLYWISYIWLTTILAIALWISNNEALDFRYLSIIGKATWNFFLQG